MAHHWRCGCEKCCEQRTAEEERAAFLKVKVTELERENAFLYDLADERRNKLNAAVAQLDEQHEYVLRLIARIEQLEAMVPGLRPTLADSFLKLGMEPHAATLTPSQTPRLRKNTPEAK